MGKTEPLKIGIRYCGGCNPGIDREEITKGILRRLAMAGIDYRILYDGDEEYPDFWLTISGCERDCTGRKDSLPEVVVAGHSVNLWKTVGTDNIVHEAVRCVLELAGPSTAQ